MVINIKAIARIESRANITGIVRFAPTAILITNSVTGTHHRIIPKNTLTIHVRVGGGGCGELAMRPRPAFITLTNIFVHTDATVETYSGIIVQITIARPFIILASGSGPLGVAEAFIFCHAFAVVRTDSVISRGNAEAGSGECVFAIGSEKAGKAGTTVLAGADPLAAAGRIVVVGYSITGDRSVRAILTNGARISAGIAETGILSDALTMAAAHSGMVKGQIETSQRHHDLTFLPGKAFVAFAIIRAFTDALTRAGRRISGCCGYSVTCKTVRVGRTVAITAICCPVTVVVHAVIAGNLGRLGRRGCRLVAAANNGITPVVRAHVAVIAIHRSFVAPARVRITESHPADVADRAIHRFVDTGIAHTAVGGAKITIVAVKIALAAAVNGLALALSVRGQVWFRAAVSVITVCPVDGYVQATLRWVAKIRGAGIAVIAIDKLVIALAAV